MWGSNGKGIEAKRTEGFGNDVFFDIDVKRTRSIVRKNFFKQSVHIYITDLNIEAKRSKLILNWEPSEAKRTCSAVKKFISKRCEHVRQ
jgi:hypothetical protein